MRAAGLGARDTLRLESAMPLYGHELTEHVTPLQAGLGFAVDLANRCFPGRDVLEALDDLRLLRDPLVEHLHRDRALERRVPRAVDRAHRPRAERRLDAVVRQHGAGIERGVSG